jgi:hypothetical protein
MWLAIMFMDPIAMGIRKISVLGSQPNRRFTIISRLSKEGEEK